jgi:hypothetical protein
VAAFLVVGFAGAEDPTPGAIRVSVLSILASERDDKIEPKLECIAREVKKVEPKLTGFRLAKMTCKSVKVGAQDRFELADQQYANVTVERGTSQNTRVQLKVAPPMLGEITYATACGKFLPILTRYRTKDNDLLILAIRVQPCHGGSDK